MVVLGVIVGVLVGVGLGGSGHPFKPLLTAVRISSIVIAPSPLILTAPRPPPRSYCLRPRPPE
jgi:hypothetical protein